MGEVVTIARGLNLPEQVKELMLDMVDKYGVWEYGNMNGAVLIIYVDKEHVIELGVSAAKELSDAFPDITWIPIDSKTIDDMHVGYVTVFLGGEWYGGC